SNERKVEPGAGGAGTGCERLTSTAEARRQRFGLQPIGAGPKQLACAAFLAGDDAARRAGTKMPLDVGAFSLRQRAIGVLGQQIADAATVRLHRWPPAAPAATGAAGADRRSKSVRRPREMRDITVPIGTFNISAISA